MKKLTFTIITLSFALLVYAQGKTPEDYIKKLPSVPEGSCSVTRDVIKGYTEQIQSLIDQVEADIDTMEKQVDSYIEANRSAIEANTTNQVAQQYGLSEAEMNKLKDSDDLSDAEKQALANKIMMQQSGMTLEQAQNLSTMSQEEKEAFARSSAAQAMINAQTNPQPQPDIEDIQNRINLVNEQKVQMNKLMENEKMISGLYDEIEKDPSRLEILGNIEKWQKEIRAFGEIINDAQSKEIDSLLALIKAEQIRYCEKLTPIYHTTLDKHLANYKEFLPEYRKMGEINMGIMKSETGLDNPPDSKDIISLQALKEYLKRSKDVYDYTLYFAEDY